MKKILLLTFAVWISTALLAQTIAFWDFNSATNDATPATGTTNPATGAGTLTLIGGVTSPSFNGGEPSDPNTTDNSAWQTTTYPALSTANKTAGLQIDASTTASAGIKLEFWQRLSGTANNTWTVQYTLDRTAGTPVWVDFQQFTFIPTTTSGNTWYFRSLDFTAVSGLNNNANAAFRVVSTFDPITGNYRAATSTSSYATSGTCRFDLVKVSATPPLVPYVLAFNRTNATVNEAAGTAQVWLKVTTVGNTAGTIDLASSTYTTASNPADYSVTATTLNVPTSLALNDSIAFTFNITDDASIESDEYIICKITNAVNVTVASTAQHTLYIKDNDRIIPTANNALNLSVLGSFSNGTAFSGPTQINSAEISAYDALSKNIYIANSIGSKLDIVDFSNPAAPTLISSIDITPYGAINSVAAKNGIIALAIENTNTQQDSGKVVFLDTLGMFIKSVNVGMMPDMIVFNHAGTKVYTANEAQPNESYNIDPDGSISIVDISAGVLNATVSHITFTAYNGQEATLRAQGIRIYGTGATASKDFEPEYITISDDDTKAWVTLQENNALAELNLTTNSVTSLIPLGYKNHATVGNGMDASDQTAAVNISNFPVKGMYQPDAIAQYSVGGNIYLLTANEGDARAYTLFNEETRVGSLNLDATVFPNAAELKNNAVLGRLRTTNKLGDTDNDGDFDEIYAYGARSFSIWNGTTGGNLVYDSGSQIEEITANDPTFGQFFNFNSGGARKDRSDDKGPEPEGVTTASINGRQYAFVGMERTGGVIVYDVTNPLAPEYVTYQNNRPTDLSPEGIFFIPENQSPNGKKLLVVSNEISSTITVYEVNPCQTADTTLTVSACVDYTLNGITYTSTGNYTQTLANAAGCDSTLYLNLTITGFPAAPMLTASQDTVCAGTSITLSTTPATGYTSAEYLWYKNDIAVNYQNGGAGTYTVSTGSTAGIDEYKIQIIYTGFACISTVSDSVNIVKISPNATITPSGTTTFCANTPTILNATAGMNNYTWKRGNAIVQSGTLASYTPIASGNHNVTVTDVDGCSKTSPWIGITVNPLPLASAGIDKNVCVGTSIQIGSTNNAANTYTWSPTTNLSNAFISNPIASPTANTSYVLTVTNGTTGCAKNDTILLTSLARPAKPAFNVVAPGSTGIQCEGTSVTLNASPTGAASVLWYKNNATLYYKDPSFDAVITASNTTTDYYKIKSKGANGCLSVVSDSVAVLIKAAPIPTITAAAPASKTGSIISIPCITGATSGTAALSGPSTMNAYTWQQLVGGTYNNVATSANYTANVSASANNKVFRLMVTYPNACSRASINNTVKLLTGCKTGDEKGGTWIGEAMEGNSLNAYPNPTQDVLYILSLIHI